MTFYWQIKWINDYHKTTAKLVGDELKKQEKMEEYDWLMEQTKPIVNARDRVMSVATTARKSISLVFMTAIIAQLFI